MRVGFFGAYDPAYPRNRILREGLARHGVEVVEARVRETRAFRRWPALAAAWARISNRCDVVLVAEFRHKDVALARLLAGPRPVVFDPLVSRWDTLVGDWGIHAPGSAQSTWNRTIDRIAFGLAARVLCDTWAHGALFESLGAARSRLARVLVGAERAFFDVPPPPASGPVRVLYVGGFLPLHGARTIVEAARRLAGRRDLPAHEIVLAGKGIEFDACRELARGVPNVSLPGAVPYATLPGLLAGAHVVLGAFGAGEKAGRVVPHKCYQGLAAGRAVVSGDGPGPREVLEDGANARLVPRGDSAALADALAALIADERARASLGAAAAATARAVATPEAVGASLVSVLEAVA